MKSVVIVQDHAGYRQRVNVLKIAHPNVQAFSPVNHPQSHTRPIQIPDDWIPADESLPVNWRCWYKSDAMGFAAVQQYNIDADFYWFIESDAVASVSRWRSLFADHEDNTADFVGNPVRTKAERPNIVWWNHPGTPPWVDRSSMISCFRLSRAAVKECIRCAPEMRECLSELTVASVVNRWGGTFASVNERQTHWNMQTMKTHEHRVIFNPELVNHPVKSDDLI